MEQTGRYSRRRSTHEERIRARGGHGSFGRVRQNAAGLQHDHRDASMITYSANQTSETRLMSFIIKRMAK